MSYFENFPLVNYRFGTQSDPTVYQNLGAYVDLLDLVKDDGAFYTYYDLQDGDRADQISQKLYNRPDLHWTFSILNDNIKTQGWPLAYRDLLVKAKKDYPNVTINTRTDLSQTFKVGSIITGGTSGSKAVVLRRRLDLGQLIVGRIAVDREIVQTTDVKGYAKLELTTPGERFTESDLWSITLLGAPVTIPTIVSGGVGYNFVEFNFGILYANISYTFNMRVINYGINPSFSAGEVITTTENDVERSAVVDTSSLEYLATHHYENVSGQYVDITPNAPFTQRATIEIELEGPSAEQIAAGVVKDIDISSTGDYTKNINLTDVQRSIDQGFYQLTGSILQLGVQATQSVADTSSPTTFTDLIGIFTSSFPTDTDLTTFNTQVYTELATAATIGDTNASGKYAVHLHVFFVVDNQLNIVLESSDAFGIVYEYDVSSVTQYITKFTEAGVTTTVSPAPTSRADAWQDVAQLTETYIQQNLSTFNPANLLQVTYLDRYEKSNNDLRRIKVLRPEIAEEIVGTFQSVLSETRATESAATLSSGLQGQGVVSVSNPSQSVTTVSGQTITSSSAAAVSSSSSSSGGGYY